jgi:hypothetical protein
VDKMTWEELKDFLIMHFFPGNEIRKVEAEFWNHSMKDADIQGYNSKFHELARLVPHMVTPEPKSVQRYIWGLVPHICGL